METVIVCLCLVVIETYVKECGDGDLLVVIQTYVKECGDGDCHCLFVTSSGHRDSRSVGMETVIVCL